MPPYSSPFGAVLQRHSSVEALAIGENSSVIFCPMEHFMIHMEIKYGLKKSMNTILYTWRFYIVHEPFICHMMVLPCNVLLMEQHNLIML